jgi:hypothetical protein
MTKEPPGAPLEGRAAMTIGSCAGAKFTDKERKVPFPYQ